MATPSNVIAPPPSNSWVPATVATSSGTGRPAATPVVQPPIAAASAVPSRTPSVISFQGSEDLVPPPPAPRQSIVMPGRAYRNATQLMLAAGLTGAVGAGSSVAFAELLHVKLPSGVAGTLGGGAAAILAVASVATVMQAREFPVPIASSRPPIGAYISWPTVLYGAELLAGTVGIGVSIIGMIQKKPPLSGHLRSDYAKVGLAASIPLTVAAAAALCFCYAAVIAAHAQWQEEAIELDDIEAAAPGPDSVAALPATPPLHPPLPALPEPAAMV